jgi:hypothetical protein
MFSIQIIILIILIIVFILLLYNKNKIYLEKFSSNKIQDNQYGCNSYYNNSSGTNEQCQNGICISGYCNPTTKELGITTNDKCVADINCLNYSGGGGSGKCKKINESDSYGICKIRDNGYGCGSDNQCDGICISGRNGGFCNPTTTNVGVNTNDKCVADINCISYSGGGSGKCVKINESDIIGTCKIRDNGYGCNLGLNDVNDLNNQCENGMCINSYCNPTTKELQVHTNYKCIADINCSSKKCKIIAGNSVGTCKIPDNTRSCSSNDDCYNGMCITGLNGSFCNPTTTNVEGRINEKCIADINCSSKICEIIAGNSVGECKNSRPTTAPPTTAPPTTAPPTTAPPTTAPPTTAPPTTAPPLKNVPSGGDCVVNSNCSSKGCRNYKCLKVIKETCTTERQTECVSGHCNDNKCDNTKKKGENCHDYTECNNYNFNTNIYETSVKCEKKNKSDNKPTCR